MGLRLPAAASAQTSLKPDSISLAVDAAGRVFFEKQQVTLEQLEKVLREKLALNRDLPVYLSGDAATPHGAMVAVLDYVRRCGVTKVGFNVKPAEIR